MEMNWADMAFKIAMTIALTQLVKHLTKDKIGYWAMAVSVALAFGITILSAPFVDWRAFVQEAIFIGVSASGLFIVAKKAGGQ